MMRGIKLAVAFMLVLLACSLVSMKTDAIKNTDEVQNDVKTTTTKSASFVEKYKARSKIRGTGGRLRRLFSSSYNQSRFTDAAYYNNGGMYYNNGMYYNAGQGNNDDDANMNDKAADDDNQANDIDDANQNGGKQNNNLCYIYFMKFLEKSTDGKDSCEGYQNAWYGAHCKNLESSSSTSESEVDYYGDDDDHDDYFEGYNYEACCQYLAVQIEATCDDSEMISNMHLLLIASVLLLCEMAKSIIKKHDIHWIPEAGGCIIVGALLGLIAHISPYKLDDLSFNEDLFLCILLPPIIFEAALEVNKFEFRRRRLAILMFAVVGTILSTFITGYVVHYGSYLSKGENMPMPLLDSFIFGALISSIDPVSILSVLSSINLTERDTVFIMVFGESLLNDGISITLFKTLVRHYENNSDSLDPDEVLGTMADFLIVGFGSLFIGVVCGVAALVYFQFLRKKLTPPMEVASFFLWAGVPYYICDECNLSGIVAIVTMGFFMDIYIAKPKDDVPGSDGSASSKFVPKIVTETPMDMQKNSLRKLNKQIDGPLLNGANDHYIDLGDSVPCDPDNFCGAASPSGRSLYSLKTFRSLRTFNMRDLIMREERFRLTQEADKHVRFVAHLLSSLSENCIFVYLGLFMYSKKYVWDLPLIAVSIVSSFVSRAIMVLIVCHLVWYINVIRQRCGCYNPTHISLDQLTPDGPIVSRTAKALQDPKIQLVLVLAGLRGAVSLALVESVPLYNEVTKVGSIYKGEMKAMTSSSIIFTIFVIGGSAYYIINKLNIATDADEAEIICIPAVETRSSRWVKDAPKPEQPLRNKPLFSDDLPSIS